MTIDLFSATGTKKGTVDVPVSLFGSPTNTALMHQLLVLQQANRRSSIAHAKTRGEVRGSTKKMFQQKGTGRARRGPVRSPLLKGGGKAFGPRSDENYWKDMPRVMRHRALCACLSLQAKQGHIVALESYADTAKTKDASALLKKLPVELGRRILIVLPSRQDALTLSVRNIRNVKTVLASYLNAEDVLVSQSIIFLKDAIAEAERVFSSRPNRMGNVTEEEVKEKAPEQKTTKTKAAKKPVAKKAASKKSPSTK